MSVCLSVDRFCKHDGITTVQDAITELYKCVVEIKMKAEFEGVWSELGAGIGV